jgi:hypothetical protein
MLDINVTIDYVLEATNTEMYLLWVQHHKEYEWDNYRVGRSIEYWKGG